jgi:hypothetical protein
MRLDRIRPGDVVECEINGPRFRADVGAKDSGRLRIVPICGNISYRHVQPNQVTRHWRLLSGTSKVVGMQRN